MERVLLLDEPLTPAISIQRPSGLETTLLASRMSMAPELLFRRFCCGKISTFTPWSPFKRARTKNPLLTFL